MSKSLVIVESPAKANTIKKFLGKDFMVMASMGHIRALPSKSGSIDVENDFEPKYHILPQRKKDLSQIKKALEKCDALYLATDIDREGEAIAWHLLEALDLNHRKSHKKRDKRPPLSIKRITFYEITKEAILNAIKNPRDIIQYLVNAQQARAVLDYLYGFNLSPFLWKKVRYGLSAGRVQSVALRLICEREEEIQKFMPKEFWTISAKLSTTEKPLPSTTFKATLVEINGKKLKKFSISNEESAKSVAKELEDAEYHVIDIIEKETSRTPPPPFTTSTLQQEAFRKLGFPAKKTMSIAQRLYEGIEIQTESVGLITYMRTDSVNISPNALQQAKYMIVQLFGDEYALKTPRHFKNRAKNVQEAHEAIRPTDFEKKPEELKSFLNRDQWKLYRLIWRRAIACQMAKAILNNISVDISAKGTHIFRVSGSVMKFQGFSKVYQEGRDNGEKEKEEILPPLRKSQSLSLLEIITDQHFTQPPSRYSEASLVKTLEEYGIGRPSTYAAIMNTLLLRGYVKIIKRYFHPEDTGATVNKLLVTHFNKYVDYDFTAKMEEDLDQIAKGEKEWKEIVRQFWGPFVTLINEKDQEIKKSDVTDEETGEKCPKCDGDLIIKLGRYGKFYACKRYPQCKYSRPFNEQEINEEDIPPESKNCGQCGKPMIVKNGRFGKFLACSGYPECRNTKRIIETKSGDRQIKEDEITDEKCEKCGGHFLIKRTRYGNRFLSCQNYPKCRNAKALSTGVPCPNPNCNGDIVERISKKGRLFFGCRNYPDCKTIFGNRPVLHECPNCKSPFLIEKVSKKAGTILECPDKECKYHTEKKAQ
ncbi:MAG: type I DNA topoisomerase [Thermodesulfobacteriota bacterium]|nr:type I DNA topoisomerase [Thermodesulfobacteriota bacterium]